MIEQKYLTAKELVSKSNRDRRKAKKILRSLGEYAPAQFLLAALIQGKRKRNRKANVLFKKSLPYYLAAQDDSDSERVFRLGIYYHLGLADIKQNYSNAYKCFLAAAEKGEPKAQIFLAKYYANGIVVEKDLAAAVKWIEKSAEQNDPEGLYMLGHSLLIGEGIEKNKQKAVEYLKKAIELGNKKALKVYRAMTFLNEVDVHK